MSAKKRWRKIQFEKPGNYRIAVQGLLDETWSDRLAGMRISTTHTENGGLTTDLIGPLRDQTQLSGILNSLYELHLPILLVEYLEEDNGISEESGAEKTSPAASEASGTKR